MWGYVAASIAGSLLGNAMTNSANIRNTRENNAHQLRMSNTSHQREVKDLRSAGLNPILSARGGAPQPASAAAKVEPYKPDVGQALVEAEQVKLLQAQSDKTRAEAVNTKLQEPYNRALADLYSSIAGDVADYFGLPLQTKSYKVTALPFRAHNLIYNEYFRDENLQSPMHVNTDDGPDHMAGIY